MVKKFNFSAFAGLILFLLFFSNCSKNTQKEVFENGQLTENLKISLPKQKVVNDELEKNRALWTAQKITDYNFLANIMEEGGGSILGEVLIKVRQGKSFSIESNIKNANGGVIKGEIEKYKDFDTFDKMFDLIQNRLDSGENAVVTYNKSFGYPETIILNPFPNTTYYFAVNVKKFERVKNVQ